MITAFVGIVLSLAPSIAAGGVVDVAVATEGRATQRDLDATTGIDALDATVAQGGFVLRPSVTGALRKEGMAGSLSYGPALSMLAPLGDPSQTLYSVLHSAELRGESTIGRRARMRAAVLGAVGELDPASAQSQLQRSSGVLDPLTAIPYGSLTTRLGAGIDFTRRLALDMNGTFELATSLGNDRIPLTTTPGIEIFGSWLATRADALLAGVNAQATNVDGRGGFIGGGPSLGWRHTLARDTGFSLTGGLGGYTASDDEVQPITVVLPRFTGELYSVMDLAGESALEAGARAGVVVINDPLGTLLENRASLGVDGGWRINRDVAVRGEVIAFAPAFAYAQRGPTASTTIATRTLLAWAIGENVSLETGVVTTSRVVEEAFASDVMLTVSFTASAPVLHTGGRPAGSGTRHLGIGTTQVGAPPRPGATTVREPPPLDVELPPAENPALAPPSGVITPEEANAFDPNAAPVSGTLRPITEQDRKKAEELKKKRREGAEKKEGDPAAPATTEGEPKEEAAKPEQ